MRNKRLAVIAVVCFAALSALLVAQTGAPITVGPTPVPVYSPGAVGSVTVVQTAGTSTAYTIYGIFKNVVANKSASSVYTFTAQPGTNFSNGQTLGYISIPSGTATFKASAAAQNNITKVTVAQLPAASAANAGSLQVVSDSTSISAEGQTCVGGSTVTALAFSNGSVWKCF